MMRKNIYFISLFVVIFSLAILMGGCGKDNGISKSATPYTASDEQGKRIYFTETNPEVVKAKEVVTNYIKATMRDYKTITGDECNPYYSQTVLSRDPENLKAGVINYYKNNKLVEVYIGSKIESISYMNDNSECVIMGKLKEKISNKDIDNKIEETPYTIYLVKENDVWKVLE